jgi:type II secretory pathway component PulM
MSAFLARLNPAERRFGIGVGLLFFVILNYLLIWPRFSDWGLLQNRLNQARGRHVTFQTTIAKASKIEPELARLKTDAGDVPPENQSLEFSRTIQNQANQSGVVGVNFGRTTTSTNNPFFQELSQTIAFQQSGESQLVDFLFKLSANNSVVRVRSLSVHPDAPRQQLAGTVTLSASYQKKPATAAAQPTASRSGAPPAGTPAAKPASQPAATNRQATPGKPASAQPAPAKPTGPGTPTPRKP